MERLFLAFLIIGAVGVSQLVPPSKGNGTGNEHADISLRATLLDANRTVEEETEIRNNASRLGTVKRLITWHGIYFTTYLLQLADTDCSKVEGWLKDIVRNTKAFTFASLSCLPMNWTYYSYEDFTYITKTTIHKLRGEAEPLWM
nr:unnamed protein product [Haemonchus contortus]